MNVLNVRFKSIFSVVLLGALAGMNVASADGWPGNITGAWSIIGNQTAGVGANGLVINQFPGAAGSQCKPIRGTIYTVDPVEGFYCPGSGRISFLRRQAGNAQPKQYWNGNLSQVVAGNPLRMGGSFAAFPHNNVGGTIGGSLGEYEFYGTK